MVTCLNHGKEEHQIALFLDSVGGLFDFVWCVCVCVCVYLDGLIPPERMSGQRSGVSFRCCAENP